MNTIASGDGGEPKHERSCENRSTSDGDMDTSVAADDAADISGAASSASEWASARETDAPTAPSDLGNDVVAGTTAEDNAGGVQRPQAELLPACAANDVAVVRAHLEHTVPAPFVLQCALRRCAEVRPPSADALRVILDASRRSDVDIGGAATADALDSAARAEPSAATTAACDELIAYAYEDPRRHHEALAQAARAGYDRAMYALVRDGAPACTQSTSCTALLDIVMCICRRSRALRGCSSTERDGLESARDRAMRTLTILRLHARCPREARITQPWALRIWRDAFRHNEWEDIDRLLHT